MPDHPLTRRLYLELGSRVRRRREALGKTQEQLAGDVGISRSSIANIERGQHHAPVHVLLGLAEALNVDMGTLLPTHTELVALVDASRHVPKLVNIGGESSLMSPSVVQMVGKLLTQSKEPAPEASARPARRSSRAGARPTRGTRGD
ncbi:MAG: hypothetical protein JWM53_6858 [bacterium]|nr:hypothetical protein [bacterium]